MVLVTNDEKITKAIEKLLEENFKEETKNDQFFKMHKDCVSTLDAFCENEADFRLREIFGLNEEDITEDLKGEIADTIRSTIDNCKRLYDVMDSDIQDVLDDKNLDYEK